MEAAYENALRTVAEAYDVEVVRWGGKSLSRVATIVVNSGTFFSRLRDGKTFSVTNLEKFASWFRVPANWPDRAIPHDAATALTSIGRPPLPANTMPHPYRTYDASVDCNRPAVFQSKAAR
ncbi:hypothetical protein EQZ23_17785 [Sphingomonas sp. UV9]|uniref:hypothetical protein n=1 Tax=Sphingomonas sp. UV9 TaxID=1851410 RepID=UPI000FFC0A1A|nr:hypothetical protein [Sphingomonas sp. UV9]RXD02475.1 hypothetical protein EQZ23_17785 [Sphingomonas sp. UV9]